MISSTVADSGKVDRLGNRAAQERLRRGHHPQMRHIIERALAFERFERAIENRQVLRLQSAK